MPSHSENSSSCISCLLNVCVLFMHHILSLLLRQGVTKGLVAEKILSSMVENGRQADFVLCVGDDRSDEDMFEDIAGVVTKKLVAPHTSIFGCTVGQKPSKARYYLDDTTDVINMLRALADASEPSLSSPEEILEPMPSAETKSDYSQ